MTAPNGDRFGTLYLVPPALAVNRESGAVTRRRPDSWAANLMNGVLLRGCKCRALTQSVELRGPSNHSPRHCALLPSIWQFLISEERRSHERSNHRPPKRRVAFSWMAIAACNSTPESDSSTSALGGGNGAMTEAPAAVGSGGKSAQGTRAASGGAKRTASSDVSEGGVEESGHGCRG